MDRPVLLSPIPPSREPYAAQAEARLPVVPRAGALPHAEPELFFPELERFLAGEG